MKVKNILYPTDFSKLSLAALESATQLAKSNGAKIHFAYCLDPAGPFDSGCRDYPVDVHADSESEVEHLKTIVPTDPEVDFEHHRLEGNTSAEIRRLAQKLGIDLIIMTTHGRTGLRRVLMGSVAESMVREAPCPLLVLRPTAQVPETVDS